jgi:hypothetical protein
MLCPHCGKAGQIAAVTLADGRVVALVLSTRIGFSPFHDEQGREHRHDPNQRLKEMVCPEGHRWKESFYLPCWCGWSP